MSESLIIIHKAYWPGRTSLLSPIGTVSVYRQPTQNLDQARHYVDKPDHVHIDLIFEFDYNPADPEKFSPKKYASQCSYREDVGENWQELEEVENCINGPLGENTYKCCSTHLCDFGVRIIPIQSTPKPRSTKDSFEGRLVIGPLFLCLFDLYLVVSIILVLFIWKASSNFQLEETGLYPTNS